MLIFLDIDGVMVPAAGWKSPQILADGFPAFSHRAVGVLRDLISVNDTMVLTTSHKSKYTIDEWKGIFERRGIKITRLQRLDNNSNNLTRKDEILNWVNSNSMDENFVIIDDDKSLFDLPRFFKEHLILTSSLVGLTTEHVERFKAIANGSLQLQ